MRARGFGLRDVFPDSLKGLCIAEEAQDLPPRDITPAQKEILTPEFDVPGIDTERSVMIEGETGEEMTATEGEISGSEPEVEDELPPEAAEEDSLEVKEMSCDEMIERILSFDNVFEHKNWLKKHAGEINALPAKEAKAVMEVYADKGEALNEPPSEALSEEGYETLLKAAGDLDALDKVWFDRVEKEVDDNKMKIRLRKTLVKKQDEFKS